MPLNLASKTGFDREQLSSQLEIVNELRGALGVGGSDYSDAE